MAASKILILLLLNPFLRCFSIENRTNTFGIADECLRALGISDGRIDDSQLTATSFYNNDFMTYGPHRARLNTTSWPPGYRADPTKAALSWMTVEIGRIVVVTAIATQGYGDEKTPEWVTSYILQYSQGSQYTFFRNADGGVQNFEGNHDSNSIRLNHVAFPVKANSVIFMPMTFHENVAFRLELYGCESDYYFVAWLMLAKTPYTIDSLASWSDPYHLSTLVGDVEDRVSEVLKDIPGFLSIHVKHFSPRESPEDEALLTAEVVIECLRTRQPSLVSRLKETIDSGETMFKSNYFELQYTADQRNLLANISLKLSKNLQDAKEILPDQSYFIEVRIASLEFNTSLAQHRDLEFKWELSTVDEGTGQFSPFIVFADNRSNITVNSQEIAVGFTYVRVSASTKSTTGAIDYDFGFIRILPSLRVKIAGPKQAFKGGGAIELHAITHGELQDSFGSKAPNVAFAWSCGEDNTTTFNASLEYDVPFNNRTSTRGCFGYDPGIPHSTSEQRVVINPDFLIAERTYVLQVLVTQGSRSVKASHRIFIDKNISLTIKCISNCEQKVSTQKKLALQIECKGLSCPFLTNYRWSLYVDLRNGSDHSWKEIENLDYISATSLVGQSLVIKGSGYVLKNQTALLRNKTYKIQVVAWLDEENYEKESYIFNTNVPPYTRDKNVGCLVDPKSGKAIATKFTVQCVNWTDSDLPISYQFSYKTQFGAVVFHTGRQPNVTTELPMGRQESNYSLYLRLEIIDSFGDYSAVYITAQVTPPDASSMMGAQKELDNLFQSGNINKAMQMAFALLSANKDTEDAHSYKSSLIDKMENVQIDSVEQATLVVGVLAMATEDENGISGDSQEKALNLLGNTVNFISSQMSNGSMDADLVQSVGTSLFSGIGNVLSAASIGAETDSEESEEDEEAQPEEDQADSEAVKEKSKQRAQNALNLVSQVGDSLLSTKAVGEEPTVFKTKSLEVLLDRQRSSDMGGKKLGEGSNGVALPSGSSLFSNNQESVPEAVDSQMLAFKKNPFTWDKSAQTVKSSVLDFKLKASGGDTLNISGLPEPVELFIPIVSKEQTSENDNSSAESLFIKPSNGTSNIRYHRFLVSSHDVLVTIQIKPEKGLTMDVFVNYKTKPTPHSNVFNVIIPNFSTCTTMTRNSSDNLNCSSDPYTFSFSSRISGYTGTHFLGIRYIKKYTKASNIDATRKRRSCGPHHRRGKRSCVDVKDAPTTPPPTPMIIIPTYNSSTDANYSLSISVSGCLYWSESKQKWTSEGCRVGPKSNSKQLHCLCTHLSAFGGDFFVAPNPIDFDKVFAAFGNLAETGNFVVLSTVCVILGLYVLGLVLARREDKRDELRVVANVLINENEGESHYSISIQTGMWRGNGTSANVGLAIYGSEGNTEDITLTDPHAEKIFFSRGSINNFTLCLPESLGSLEKIRIWHDNSGNNPSWFLMQVVIVDLATGEKVHFVANRWIAVEKEDGKLDLELQVASKKEISGFKNLFYARTATKLGEKHLWLSLFTRPPHNPFTRAQRLACCISILFAAMVTNAMFYNFGTPPGDAVQVGPLKVSLTQIKIGIQSSIIAIPVNVLVVTIFRQLKANDAGKPEGEGRKSHGCLPHWFLFVGWFICTMATLASAAFVVFYSLMWGAETSNEWLVSVMVSFFQDAIVMQPMKVLLVASILSILVKKPPEQEKVMGDAVQRNAAGEVITPDQVELERARKFRSSLVQVGRKVVEFVLFGIFITLMMVVCYGNRGVERFMVTQSMDDLFQTFRKVNNVPSFWKWSKKVLVPNLYNVDWYNGRPFKYEEGFLSNRAAFLVGMPRMRQLRVKTEENCSIATTEPILARQFSRCIPFYTGEAENMSPYNGPGWIPVQNASAFYSDFELEKECPRPWRYQRPDDLQLRSYGGQMATFVGGGYIADLGYNSRTALNVIGVLENDGWIDDRTAAIFTEFTIFEPSSSLFSTVKLLFERSPTGGSNVAMTIKTLSLYAPPEFRSTFQICQLLLMIVLIVFFFAEIGKLRREKCSYFKQIWNWLELLQITSTICSLVFFFLKESRTSQYVKKLQENPFETSSTDNIEYLSDMETYVLAFVLFIITIKFLRLIKFNRHVCQVMGTLQRAATQVLSFMIVFVTILLAYTQVGFLVFSSNVDAYRSFYSCLRAMLLLLFGGDMRFQELQSTSRFITPVFIFGYLSSMAMVLLNMFLAILNDSYYEVKNVEAGDAFADAELGAFMTDYTREKISKLKDETFELIDGTIMSLVSFVRDKKQQYKQDEELPPEKVESVGGKSQLASLDPVDDIGCDEDEDGEDETHPLSKAASLNSIFDYSVSLTDLKETILQIGREMRQSLTSLKSAVSNHSLNQLSSRCDYTLSLDLLVDDDETWNCHHTPSPYFSAFGSYLEDIWQKEEERRKEMKKEKKKERKKDRHYRHYKRRQKLAKIDNYEKRHMLRPADQREAVVNLRRQKLAKIDNYEKRHMLRPADQREAVVNLR